jgi:hypothetical protein
MFRVIAALFLLLASAAASSAQGLFPSVWQGQRGATTLLREISPEFSSAARRAPVREFPMIWQGAFAALGSCSRRRGTGRQIAERPRSGPDALSARRPLPNTCNTRSRRQSVPITRPRRSATGRHAMVRAAKRIPPGQGSRVHVAGRAALFRRGECAGHGFQWNHRR